MDIILSKWLMGNPNPLNSFQKWNGPPKKTRAILSSFFSVLALGTVFSAGFLAHDYVSPQRSDAFTMPTQQQEYAMGYSGYGELGFCSSNSNESSPTEGYISAPLYSKIAAGNEVSLGLTPNGNVYAWGSNYSGAIGQSYTGLGANSLCPEEISGLSNVTDIAVGGDFYHSFALALEANGTVWAWGSNNGGQLGNGTSSGTPQYTVSEVLAPSGSSGYLTNITAIAASEDTNGVTGAAAVRSDGTVFVWGDNQFYEFGNGSTSPNYSGYPVQNTTLTNVKSIAYGEENLFALESDGTVWSWGQNTFGDTGNTSTSGSSCSKNDTPPGSGAYCVTTPHQISGLSNITDISGTGVLNQSSNRYSTQSVFVQSGGNVYTLGQYQNSPTQITSLSGIVKAQSGYADYYNSNIPSIIALKDDGTVYKSTVTTSIGTASQISGISKVTDIATGAAHLLFLSAE